MTSHEFDTHCDTLPDSHFEPSYHDDIALVEQQMRAETERYLAEMEVERENALRREGARAALEAVRREIAKIWNNPSSNTGLWIAEREVQEQINGL